MRRRRRPDEALRRLIRDADRARDERRFEEAAGLYGKVLAIAPQLTGLVVQRAHALKECGQYAAAEAGYLTARRLMPDDSDLALQLGHFFKLSDRTAEAENLYSEALRLRPGWEEAATQLAASAARRRVSPDVGTDRARDSLIPALAPTDQRPHATGERGPFILHRLGQLETTSWGSQRTLRGIEALRGVLLTEEPITGLQIHAGDSLVYAGGVSSNAAVIPASEGAVARNKAVFNVWFDSSPLPRGIATIALRFTDRSGKTHMFTEDAVIGAPATEEDHPSSDSVVSGSAGAEGMLDRWIDMRPSMIRDARRRVIPPVLRSILVLRTDQLGDMVASIAALRRLRELAPEARLVALVTTGNVDLARTLGLFDELIVIEFPDDPVERRRIMPLDQQEALRARLAPYAFDVAIDLAPSHVSRALLRLSGARFLHGFASGDEWPWLDGRVAFHTPDARNGHDVAPHSTKMLALIETLGALIAPPAGTIRRQDLPRTLLAAYNLGLEEQFIVLHTGARLAFSRWPHFAALAARLLAETRCTIVVLQPDDAGETTMPETIATSPRVRLLGHVPFDHLDALLSYASVMVGNDSGPKHLAALRGTPTVTLFTARINWSEWGQENVGSIISRRVPCAGCAIFHDPDECGRDFTCIRRIAVDEVLQVVQKHLSA